MTTSSTLTAPLPAVGSGPYAAPRAADLDLDLPWDLQFDDGDRFVAGYGPRYRLTRRGRLVAVLMGVVAILACGIAYATGSAASGDGRSETRIVVVQPGQSLWSLASGVTGGRDVQPMIERIESLNHLDGAGDVQAGQRLRIPTDD